ncbi:glycosyltransferase family 4 protein [Desulfovibrio sp. DV]|uniref:glycosyltransferase family 4 protein n=1 Tax=Desulfovibrio sp. DV TaxID=1844708 RepID=UPI00094B9B6B|nr:glycosyltransferase family 4 protein [Desulfovibrio sp. DV]
MRALVYTSLFPASWAPTHGIFVKELVRHLADLLPVATVVPENGWRRLFAPSTANGRPIASDSPIFRCRFWTIPKFCKGLDAHLMALASKTAFRRALQDRPDLVHAHFAYPDAAAAALLACEAGLPLVVTCHGSDINVLTQNATRKTIIARSLRQAVAVVTVSKDLSDKVASLGVDPDRIHTIPNGVDLSRFQPGDKNHARRHLGIGTDGPLLAAVGRLEPVKGYDRLLEAVAAMPDINLVLVGHGSLRRPLEHMAAQLRIQKRVHFAGPVRHEDLAIYFQAADCLVISSHSEGWPTVIHEALACGTPVVAPAVGGIPEALADPALGVVVPSGQATDLRAGIRLVLDKQLDHAALVESAAAHQWSHVARRYRDLYASILKRN